MSARVDFSAFNTVAKLIDCSILLRYTVLRTLLVDVVLGAHQLAQEPCVNVAPASKATTVNNFMLLNGKGLDTSA